MSERLRHIGWTYRMLKMMFHDKDKAKRWFYTANKHPMFNGGCAMELINKEYNGAEKVHKYLRSVMGGDYA